MNCVFIILLYCAFIVNNFLFGWNNYLEKENTSAEYFTMLEFESFANEGIPGIFSKGNEPIFWNEIKENGEILPQNQIFPASFIEILTEISDVNSNYKMVFSEDGDIKLYAKNNAKLNFWNNKYSDAIKVEKFPWGNPYFLFSNWTKQHSKTNVYNPIGKKIQYFRFITDYSNFCCYFEFLNMTKNTLYKIKFPVRWGCKNARIIMNPDGNFLVDVSHITNNYIECMRPPPFESHAYRFLIPTIIPTKLPTKPPTKLPTKPPTKLPTKPPTKPLFE